MYSKEAMIKDENGLHARPASEFVQKASEFESDINIIYGDRKINAKSIVGLLSGGIRKGKIIIEANGPDEKEAVESLVEVIER